MDLDCKHPTPPSMGRGADWRRRGGFNSRKRSPVFFTPVLTQRWVERFYVCLPGRIVRAAHAVLERGAETGAALMMPAWESQGK